MEARIFEDARYQGVFHGFMKISTKEEKLKSFEYISLQLVQKNKM